MGLNFVVHTLNDKDEELEVWDVNWGSQRCKDMSNNDGDAYQLAVSTANTKSKQVRDRLLSPMSRIHQG